MNTRTSHKYDYTKSVITSVVTVDSLRGWLNENGTGIEHDLTVDDVATFFGRSPVTVRAWIRGGRLRAYQFRGREYRVPESALEEFQERERNEGQ